MWKEPTYKKPINSIISAKQCHYYSSYILGNDFLSDKKSVMVKSSHCFIAALKGAA